MPIPSAPPLFNDKFTHSSLLRQRRGATPAPPNRSSHQANLNCPSAKHDPEVRRDLPEPSVVQASKTVQQLKQLRSYVTSPWPQPQSISKADMFDKYVSSLNHSSVPTSPPYKPSWDWPEAPMAGRSKTKYQNSPDLVSDLARPPLMAKVTKPFDPTKDLVRGQKLTEAERRLHLLYLQKRGQAANRKKYHVAEPETAAEAAASSPIPPYSDTRESASPDPDGPFNYHVKVEPQDDKYRFSQIETTKSQRANTPPLVLAPEVIVIPDDDSSSDGEDDGTTIQNVLANLNTPKQNGYVAIQNGYINGHISATGTSLGLPSHANTNDRVATQKKVEINRQVNAKKRQLSPVRNTVHLQTKPAKAAKIVEFEKVHVVASPAKSENPLLTVQNGARTRKLGGILNVGNELMRSSQLTTQEGNHPVHTTAIQNGIQPAKKLWGTLHLENRLASFSKQPVQETPYQAPSVMHTDYPDSIPNPPDPIQLEKEYLDEKAQALMDKKQRQSQKAHERYVAKRLAEGKEVKPRKPRGPTSKPTGEPKEPQKKERRRRNAFMEKMKREAKAEAAHRQPIRYEGFEEGHSDNDKPLFVQSDEPNSDSETVYSSSNLEERKDGAWNTFDDKIAGLFEEESNDPPNKLMIEDSIITGENSAPSEPSVPAQKPIARSMSTQETEKPPSPSKGLSVFMGLDKAIDEPPPRRPFPVATKITGAPISLSKAVNLQVIPKVRKALEARAPTAQQVPIPSSAPQPSRVPEVSRVLAVSTVASPWQTNPEVPPSNSSHISPAFQAVVHSPPQAENPPEALSQPPVEKLRPNFSNCTFASAANSVLLSPAVWQPQLGKPKLDNISSIVPEAKSASRPPPPKNNPVDLPLPPIEKFHELSITDPRCQAAKSFLGTKTAAPNYLHYFMKYEDRLRPIINAKEAKARKKAAAVAPSCGPAAAQAGSSASFYNPFAAQTLPSSPKTLKTPKTTKAPSQPKGARKQDESPVKRQKANMRSEKPSDHGPATHNLRDEHGRFIRIDRDEETEQKAARKQDHSKQKRKSSKNEEVIQETRDPYELDEFGHFRRVEDEEDLESEPDAPRVSQLVERPKTAGKQLNDKAVREYYASQQEKIEPFDRQTMEEMEADAERNEREPSPITQEDECNWVYRVKRKQWLMDQYESNAEWFLVGAPAIYSLVKANQASAKEVLFERNGFAIKPGEWDYMLTKRDKNGLNYHKAACWYGFIHVKVERTLRAKGSGQLPASKDGWISKRIYIIKKETWILKPKEARVAANPVDSAISSQRTSQEEQDDDFDDLFDEAPEATEPDATARSERSPSPFNSSPSGEENNGEETDDDIEYGEPHREDFDTYTILDNANRQACYMVRDLAAPKGSRHIEAGNFLRDWLPELEKKCDGLKAVDEAFDATLWMRGMRVRVFVEEKKLNGPWNI